jgi:hypothetical protein
MDVQVGLVGWINSPLGALVSDPTITGKMSFGYNSKFFRTATNPKGESQLNFLLGDFDFNALNYEYLVIDQARAQSRGFGKVNGVSGYDFIATVMIEVYPEPEELINSTSRSGKRRQVSSSMATKWEPVIRRIHLCRSGLGAILL